MHRQPAATAAFVRHPLACALLALFALPASAAEDVTLAPVKVAAQTDQEPPSERSGAYTVRRSRSATGLNLSLRETPQTVSVITRAQMDDFQLNSVNDALSASSGVMVEKIETSRTYYTARGFDITSFQADGVGMPFIYGNIYGDMDAAIYDRVEAVYGANGLMTSTGYPAATINFVRKRPTVDLQASVKGTLGSWNTYRLDADVSRALVESGAIRGRLVVAREDGDSYLDRYGLAKTVFYGVVEADLGPATQLTIGHNEQANKARSPIWGALPMFYTDGTRTNYSRSTSPAADWAYWDTTYKTSFAELTHEFDNRWQARAVLTRNDNSNDSALLYVYGRPDKATGLGVLAYPARYNASNQQTQADVQLSGPFRLWGQEHELTLGANWSKSELNDATHYGRGIGTALPALDNWDGSYPMPLFDASTDGSAFTYRQRSAFAAARITPTDGLKLIGGARATRADSDGISYGVARNSKASDVTPYFGVVYDLTPNLSAYASHADIFTPQYQLDASGNVLKPVEGRSSEIGLKGEFFQRRLNASLAVFRTVQDNLAEVAGYNGTKAYYGGINARSRGFQFDMAGQLAPRLEANLGYTQLSLHGDDGEDVRTYTPRRLLRLAATYRLPFVDKLKIGANLSHQGDVYAMAGSDELRQKAYTLIGLTARYDISKQLSVSATLRNLTDEKYLSSLYWGSYGQGYYGAPRNGSIALAWTY